MFPFRNDTARLVYSHSITIWLHPLRTMPTFGLLILTTHCCWFGRHRFSIGWVLVWLAGWLVGWRCLFVATFFAQLCFASCFYLSLNESRSDNRQLDPNIKGDEIKLNNKNVLWSHNLYLCDNVLRFAEEWSKSKCCFVRLEYAQAHGKICFIHVSYSFIHSFTQSFIFFSFKHTLHPSLFTTVGSIWLGIFPFSIHFHKHFME